MKSFSKAYRQLALAVVVSSFIPLANAQLTPMTQTNNVGTNIWTAPARAARKPNPVLADAASLTRGKQLFTAACLPCHGPSGRGDGPASASLERKPGNLTDAVKMHSQMDGAIFWKISEGNTPMPSFRDAFTEEQRWDIVNYVRTLASPTPNDPSQTKK